MRLAQRARVRAATSFFDPVTVAGVADLMAAHLSSQWVDKTEPLRFCRRMAKRDCSPTDLTLPSQLPRCLSVLHETPHLKRKVSCSSPWARTPRHQTSANRMLPCQRQPILQTCLSFICALAVILLRTAAAAPEAAQPLGATLSTSRALVLAPLWSLRDHFWCGRVRESSCLRLFMASPLPRQQQLQREREAIFSSLRAMPRKPQR